jgi:hypothetical protein
MRLVYRNIVGVDTDRRKQHDAHDNGMSQVKSPLRGQQAEGAQ